MCGIISIMRKYGENRGTVRLADELIEGLHALEYRGYDSAGLIAIEEVGEEERAVIEKSLGKVADLEKMWSETKAQEKHRELYDFATGIAHTRWATHGAVTLQNVHPIIVGSTCLVHNGIIENHQELRGKLVEKGAELEGETDTEIIAHLINYYLNQEKLEVIEAIQTAIKELKGVFSLVVMFIDRPRLLVGVQQGLALMLGVGRENDEEYVVCLSSDEQALGPDIVEAISLERGEMVIIEDGQYMIEDGEGRPVERQGRKVSQKEKITRGDHQTFMIKEIQEQPRILIDLSQDYLRNKGIIDPQVLKRLKDFQKVYIIACGSAYYSGMVARYWLEKYARIEARVEIASEFCMREPVLKEDQAYIFISQSGETADTLGAAKYVKEKLPKALTIGLINREGSHLAELVDYVIYTKAGPEAAVASTKAFTAQLLLLLLLAIGWASDSQAANLVTSLDELLLLEKLVPQLDIKMKSLTESLFHNWGSSLERMVVIGRGTMYPIAMEGALKILQLTFFEN